MRSQTKEKTLFASTTGTLKGKERKAVYQEIREGKTHIIVGTHSLVQKEIQFKNLGLAVVDEQHRFGVKQREELINKGFLADILVMTATPIPRSNDFVKRGKQICKNRLRVF